MFPGNPLVTVIAAIIIVAGIVMMISAIARDPKGFVRVIMGGDRGGDDGSDRSD